MILILPCLPRLTLEIMYSIVFFQTLAYWMTARNAHLKEFCAMIDHMTQVVIDLSKREDKNFLQVRKASGRYDPETYQLHEYLVKGLKIDILQALMWSPYPRQQEVGLEGATWTALSQYPSSGKLDRGARSPPTYVFAQGLRTCGIPAERRVRRKKGESSIRGFSLWRLSLYPQPAGFQ
jgi:hypothetical protein